MTEAEIKEIVKRVDHTLLSPLSTEREISILCDEGMEYGAASVCVPPSRVAFAAGYTAKKLPVCTVIGFPNGYCTSDTKCFETEKALSDGASEIDMVANLGNIREGRYDLVLDEIKRVRSVCRGRILKVIVETCLLTESEKVRMCGVVYEGNADYIKTSTGFSSYGATDEDVRLLVENAPPGLLVKASGGIKTLLDAERFISLGASRLGTSRVIKLIKETEKK